MTSVSEHQNPSRLAAAAPFWLSLTMVPLAFLAATQGTWALWLMPLGVPLIYAVIDGIVGSDVSNADPNTPDSALYWHRMITLIWPPIQIATIFGILFYVTQSGHLTRVGEWFLFIGLGVMSGAVGINYSHELMHQKPKLERWLADILLGSVMYGHFRSEHLLVHHRYVGTRKDPVTARYNENFHYFFPRVVYQCLVSAFKAEKAMLARKNLPWWHHTNPFWRYWALELGFCVLAFSIAGWWGVFLFLTQAYYAILYLEVVNYTEHYGLTRKHLGDGKYEHVKPQHSWNADPKVSNWLLINLQRHSDHHFKPDRRFPLLQTYDADDAPQLPYSYPAMGFIALYPPLWRKIMNPRVRAWRQRYYPEIEDWTPYNKATNPMPR